MNTARLIVAAAVLALAGTAGHAADKTTDKAEKSAKPAKTVKSDRTEKNEAKLAERLKGRTAGESVTCIPMLHSNRLEVLDGVALVYELGDTIYVARPTDPASLDHDDIMVIDRFGDQLCSNDVIKTVDRTGGYLTGVVFLNKFVPYKKQN